MTTARNMTLNMGPQHPSTHGVLRLVLELDGEVVVRCVPHIGYLHTGIEKGLESKRYQQGIPLTDRLDYLAPLSNNLAYVLAIEKALGIEPPERAQTIRVLLTELTRIKSHPTLMESCGSATRYSPLSGERFRRPNSISWAATPLLR